MVQGSVIEVATWRGVGRPDSRTSRLMLGMGSGNVNEDSDAAESPQSGAPAQQRPSKPQGFAGVIFTIQHFIKNFNRINWAATFKALLASLTSKKAKKVKKSQAKPVDAPVSAPAGVTPGVTISRASDDADIEAWLNSITAKASRDSSKARTSANSKPAAAKSAPAKSATKAKAPAKKAATRATSSRSVKKR